MKYFRKVYERGLIVVFGGNLSIRVGDLVFIKVIGFVMDEMILE